MYGNLKVCGSITLLIGVTVRVLLRRLEAVDAEVKGEEVQRSGSERDVDVTEGGSGADRNRRDTETRKLRGGEMKRVSNEEVLN